jgi:hypothetical protein
MTIDLTNIIKLIQKKAASVDVNTPTQDLVDLIKAAKKADGNLLIAVDSAGDLPIVETSIGTLAYQTDLGVLRINNGRWDAVASMPVALGAWSPVGKTYGYAVGGGGAAVYLSSIDKFVFATGLPATNIGNISDINRYNSSGHSSGTHGYTTGGQAPAQPTFPIAGNTSEIAKFSFVTEANGTLVGNLIRQQMYGAGISNAAYGYIVNAQKYYYDPVPGSDEFTTQIERFSFSSDANSAYVGNMAFRMQTNYGKSSGHNSETHGYSAGGRENNYAPYITKNYIPGDRIQSFPFAADDATAEVVGQIAKHSSVCGGLSSTTHGYLLSDVGGHDATNYEEINFGQYSVSPKRKEVDAFQFANGSVHGFVSNLMNGESQRGAAGSSSTSDGFFSGSGGQQYITQCSKFPFASNADAVSVGSLTIARYSPTGHQY